MKVTEGNVGHFKAKMLSVNDMTLGISTEIGPRILSVFSNKKPEFNLFGLSDLGLQMVEGFWKLYGGHRLWSSPEAIPRSYSLDNKPVKIEEDKDSITIYGNPEFENSIQKTITLKPFSENGVHVIHMIKNIGRWPIRIACWALSVMRQDGFAIIPIKPSKTDDEGLLPDRRMTLWPYTDLSDKRLTFTNKYVFIKQNPKSENNVKIGVMANPTWTAYWVDGTAFVKQFSKQDGEYPDFGCSVEVYTSPNFLELETVSPLKIVNPSESIQHIETWKILEVGELAQKPADFINELEVQL